MDHSKGNLVRGQGIIHTVLQGIVWIGSFAAWLLLPILLLILAGVVLSAAKVGTIFSWENDIFLFGSKLTLSSLGDLQWHLFGIMLMLSMAGTLVSEKHVRVDFLRQNMSHKHKTIVDLLGHVVLLLPLCGIVAFHGYDFTIRSWNMNEGSNYDGLYNRFILKSFIPIGFFMLFLAGIGLILRDLNALFRSKDEATDD